MADISSVGSTNDSTDDVPISTPSMLYCNCRHSILCSKCGQPHSNRTQTKQSVDALVTGDNRPSLANVYGHGPLLVSDVPLSSVKSLSSSSTTSTSAGGGGGGGGGGGDGIDGNNDGASVVLGIDEAGRGSVLGPMVYGCAYWSADRDVQTTIPKGFHDSKQLKEEQRNKLWDDILDHPHIGFCVRTFLPSEISRNMLRSSHEVYNLNDQSHDAAMTMIRKVMLAGVNVTRAYIDTVGNPGHYKRKLEREFPTIEFVVESKADAKYPPCSAASVVAKVLRDRMLEQWQYSEPGLEKRGGALATRQFGSGYPSDPTCKAWMQELQDPVFGYTDLIRFSWAPTKQRLSGEDENTSTNTTTGSSGDGAVKVVFCADLDEEEEENLQQSKGMAQFLCTSTNNGTTGCFGAKRKRAAYFDRRKIQVTKRII